MNRYQQLKQELEREKARIVLEFQSNARVGDFVMLKDTVGILSKSDPYRSWVLLPICLGTESVIPLIVLDADNITELQLFGDDFDFIAKYLQGIAQNKAKVMESIPF